MEEKRHHWGGWAVGIALGVLFFVYIWPGLWIYSGDGQGMVRVNRLKGVIERASELGWGTEAQLSSQARSVHAADLGDFVERVRVAYQRGEVDSFESDGGEVTIHWKSGEAERREDPASGLTRALERAGVKRVYR